MRKAAPRSDGPTKFPIPEACFQRGFYYVYISSFRLGLANSAHASVCCHRHTMAGYLLSFHLGQAALGLGPARAMYLGPGSHGSAQPSPFIVSHLHTLQSSLNFAQEGPAAPNGPLPAPP